MTQTTVCLVCGSEADGVHYNAVSCRSCNAFFRRAVTFDHKYVCRKNGHCDVSQRVRCACRACRFQKCLNAGMDRSAVQPPRDPTGSQKTRKRTAQPIQTAETASMGKKVSNSAPVPRLNDDEDEDTNLDQLAQSYRDQIRMQQLQYTSVEDFLNEQEKGTIFREAKYEDLQAVSKSELSALMFWLEKLYPFKKLPKEDRIILMNKYSMRKLCVDSIYFSSKFEGEAENRCLMVNNTYIERGMTGFEMPNDDAETIKTKQTLFNPTYERFRESVFVPFRNMRITLHEVTTLHVLLMWSPILSQDVSLSTRLIMQQRRNKIIGELFEHYEKINFPDPEVRMGNILLLLPDIETLIEQHAQDFYVAKLFKLCDVSETWYDKVVYNR